MENQKNQNNKRNNQKKTNNIFKNPLIVFLALSLISTVVLNFVMGSVLAPQEKEIYYSEFINMVKEDKIESVQMSSEKLIIKPKSEKETENTEDDNKQLSIGLNSNINKTRNVVYYTGNINNDELLKLLDEHSR